MTGNRAYNKNRNRYIIGFYSQNKDFWKTMLYCIYSSTTNQEKNKPYKVWGIAYLSSSEYITWQPIQAYRIRTGKRKEKKGRQAGWQSSFK